jgi:hypothetical protein
MDVVEGAPGKDGQENAQRRRDNQTRIYRKII